MSFLSTVFVLILICLLVYMAVVFNQLVKNKNIVKEAWSGIDVQLKQRHVLVPSLLKVVLGYMKYEKTLLEEITNIRSSITGTSNKSTVFDNASIQWYISHSGILKAATLTSSLSIAFSRATSSSSIPPGSGSSSGGGFSSGGGGGGW